MFETILYHLLLRFEDTSCLYFKSVVITIAIPHLRCVEPSRTSGCTLPTSRVTETSIHPTHPHPDHVCSILLNLQRILMCLLLTSNVTVYWSQIKLTRNKCESCVIIVHQRAPQPTLPTVWSLRGSFWEGIMSTRRNVQSNHGNR